MKIIWTVLIIFWIIVIVFPAIIAILLGVLFIFIWLNILIFLRWIKWKKKWEEYVKFGKYKIYR